MRISDWSSDVCSSDLIELYPRSTAAPQITPLLSQPIVELCLSIPTWQWVRGGRDRAVARAAVADLLPALIAQRRTKGGPTGFLRRVFNARADDRSEERRVGKEGVSTCKCRGSPDDYKKNTKNKE